MIFVYVSALVLLNALFVWGAYSRWGKLAFLAPALTAFLLILGTVRDRDAAFEFTLAVLAAISLIYLIGRFIFWFIKSWTVFDTILFLGAITAIAFTSETIAKFYAASPLVLLFLLIYRSLFGRYIWLLFVGVLSVFITTYPAVLLLIALGIVMVFLDKRPLTLFGKLYALSAFLPTDKSSL